MLYTGPAGAADDHAHHAVQIVHGLDGPVRLTLDGRTVDTRVGVIAPGTPHAFDARGGRVALVLLDAHGPRGAALTRQARRAIGGAVLPVDPPPAPPDLTPDEALTWCEQLLQSLGWRSEEPQPTAPAVQAALTYLDSTVTATPTLAAAARYAHVSPSRLTHTFTRQVGIPFRRFVLWLRLKRAVEQVQSGATLTEAAALAGFSDSAHLSRAFRVNFGLPPSAVLLAGVAPAGSWPALDCTTQVSGTVNSTATFKPAPGTPT
jgi:AraC-like DNA-binding protein